VIERPEREHAKRCARSDQAGRDAPDGAVPSGRHDRGGAGLHSGPDRLLRIGAVPEQDNLYRRTGFGKEFAEPVGHRLVVFQTGGRVEKHRNQAFTRTKVLWVLKVLAVLTVLVET
jgi:hypothetical protein